MTTRPLSVFPVTLQSTLTHGILVKSLLYTHPFPQNSPIHYSINKSSKLLLKDIYTFPILSRKVLDATAKSKQLFPPDLQTLAHQLHQHHVLNVSKHCLTVQSVLRPTPLFLILHSLQSTFTCRDFTSIFFSRETCLIVMTINAPHTT